MDMSLRSPVTNSMQNKVAPPVSKSDGPLCVYIWDMDETLILLKSLLDGTYGLKDVKKGKEIGKLWENRILQVCDEIFFYEQVSHSFNHFFLEFIHLFFWLSCPSYLLNFSGNLLRIAV